MAKIKLAKDITYRINGETTPGYLAVPDSPSPAPSVIVIQEVWGLNDDIRRICRMFAEAGYAALSPDLYNGRSTTDLEEAMKIRATMEMARAVKDIDVAIKYLQALPEAKNKPVGMIGFCMGGGLTLETAIRGGKISAGACFYGGPQGDLGRFSTIKVPILCAFGAEDHLIPLSRVEEIRQALQKNKIDHEVHVYQGAGHSFFNEVKPEWYKPDVAKVAWGHVLAFYERTLKKTAAKK